MSSRARVIGIRLEGVDAAVWTHRSMQIVRPVSPIRTDIYRHVPVSQQQWQEIHLRIAITAGLDQIHEAHRLNPGGPSLTQQPN